MYDIIRYSEKAPELVTKVGSGTDFRSTYDSMFDIASEYSDDLGILQKAAICLMAVQKEARVSVLVNCDISGYAEPHTHFELRSK